MSGVMDMMPLGHPGVPGFEAWLGSQLRLSANAHPRKQWQWLRLPPTWKTRMELPASSVAQHLQPEPAGGSSVESSDCISNKKIN